MNTRARHAAALPLALLLAVTTLTAARSRAAVAVPAPACPAATGVHRDAPGAGKTVALTFDDGPGADTAKILGVLSAAHAEATFFNVGYVEAAAPRLVRAEHAAGFAVGDHTWDHADLTTLDAAGQAAEIDRERAKQASITGAYSCLFRPPYGSYDARTLQLARERGLQVWLWSVDPEDWKAAGSGAAFWVHRIISRAKAGGSQRHPVLIMHNQPGGNPATVKALPAILDFYRSHGYTFVNLNGDTGHPVVRRMSTGSGRLVGGTRVTIEGHGFLGVRAVHFGHLLGTRLRVLSSTELVVTSPAHRPGTVPVSVRTTFGTSPPSARADFRYVAPPTVTSIVPATGPSTGGTQVVVRGTDFRHVRAVWFGGVQGSAVHVITPQKLAVTSPPHGVGSYPIRVVTDFGRSDVVPAAEFVFTLL
jgi:peptidoglycan/xylan/chitin deacetylase (PgdA/CDA1 family)